jgi:hypothetical protein
MTKVGNSGVVYCGRSISREAVVAIKSLTVRDGARVCGPWDDPAGVPLAVVYCNYFEGKRWFKLCYILTNSK